jgi:hypothetical protein
MSTSLRRGATALICAAKDVYCSNSLALPAGWLKATGVTQFRYQSGSWMLSAGPQTNANAYTTNAVNSSIGSSGSTCGDSNWTYRTFEGHEVLVLGGWQNTLTESPPLWWGC